MFLLQSNIVNSYSFDVIDVCSRLCEASNHLHSTSTTFIYIKSIPKNLVNDTYIIFNWVVIDSCDVDFIENSHKTYKSLVNRPSLAPLVR